MYKNQKLSQVKGEYEKTMPENLRVAVCGELPTACDFLLKQGVCSIDYYSDATHLSEESAYHLILIYAPNAEGILDTVYMQPTMSGEKKSTVPIRLLNEPCCHSALLELKSMLRRIRRTLHEERSGA